MLLQKCGFGTAGYTRNALVQWETYAKHPKLFEIAINNVRCKLLNYLCKAMPTQGINKVTRASTKLNPWVTRKVSLTLNMQTSPTLTPQSHTSFLQPWPLDHTKLSPTLTPWSHTSFLQPWSLNAQCHCPSKHSYWKCPQILFSTCTSCVRKHSHWKCTHKGISCLMESRRKWPTTYPC